MVKQGLNTFDGGMNKDLADRLLPSNKYRDAQNMRLITTKGGTTGNLENIKGNKFIFDTLSDWPDIAGFRVAGGIELRDDIILFMTMNYTDDPVSEGGDSRLYRLKLDLDLEELTSEPELLYDDTHLDIKLNLSTYYPIKAIAKYETPNIQKVYWTDGYNNMRYVNVASVLTVDGVVGSDYMSVDKFEYLPKFVFSKPILKDIVGGKVNTGMVAYAYQLYIMNGAETAFSALSDPISVVSDSDFLTDTKNYKGDKEVVNSGKGFVMEIDNTDNIGYNRLRLVRVEYSYLNSVPEIYICNEIAISPIGDIVQVTDVGDVLGTLTVDEFNLVSTELFTCQDIASKDNRLFVSNIEKKEFIVDDWDARAVRFHVTDGATVIDSTEDPVTILTDLSNWDDYVSTHDGINEFNNPNNDGVSDYAFKYQKNGTTLGAEGPNIVIDFETAPVTIDTSNNNTTFYTSTNTVGTDKSYKSYASPWKGGMLSWQRDEVYRLFVVFGNDRGQVADPKWICDLRMPSLHDNDFDNSSAVTCYPSVLSEHDSITTHTTWTNRLYPRVYFKSFPTNATWAQIHRVKRERPDRFVVTQCFVVPTDVNGSTYYPARIDTENLSTDGVELVKLVSPEININKNIYKQPNDYLEYVTNYEIGGRVFTDSDTDYFNRHIYKLIENTRLPFAANTKTDIIEGVQISSMVVDTDYITLNNKNYSNYHATTTNTKGCSGLLLNYDNTAWSIEGNAFAIVNYKSNVYGSQYGGNTYEDRMNNISIPCSDVISSVDNWFDISYGDTFINYFDVSTFLYDLSFANVVNSLSESVYIPLESSINCDLIYGNSSAHLTYDITKAALRQEYAGEHIAGDSDVNKYNQEENLYSYNTVYSQQIDIKPAISLVVDKILETKFDSMVKSSNKKSNGEITDSWTKFGVNEFIEVDSIYGPVQSLFNFNNKLFYFQDKAFGVLSVNDRSVIQDTTTAKLVLGTGGVLDRYDYVSILCGSKDKFSIVGGDTGMFWFDRINNYLIKYSDSIDKISISKGMQSYLNEIYPQLGRVISHSDKNNNEILFTFMRNTLPEYNSPATTLAYSENVDSFISFYNFVPAMYIPYKNRYLTTWITNSWTLYLHDSNISPRGRFYYIDDPSYEESDYYHPSTIKVLFNQDYNYTKAWDNISYISNVYDTDGFEMYNQTLSSIRCYNDYQNSDYVTLIYGDNIMRRERSWTLAVPRNAIENIITGGGYELLDPDVASLDPTRPFRERLRDKYMIADLVYTNDNTKDRFVLGNVGVKYRLSYR